MDTTGNEIVVLFVMLFLVFVIYKILYANDLKSREAFIEIFVAIVMVGMVISFMDIMDKIVWKGGYQTLKVIANILIMTGFAFLFGYRRRR